MSTRGPSTPPRRRRHGRRIDSGRRSIARGDLFAALHTGAFAALDDVPVIGDQDDGATDGRGGGHQRVEPLEPVDPPHGADRIGAVEGVVDVVEDARATTGRRSVSSMAARTSTANALPRLTDSRSALWKSTCP
ncbi:hypothetical protein GS455_10350 [Rhodococcus hoagii]|nr:hypothetical protein [Prescottella equi]